ncbi:MFS transporter [Fundidesulfovibrio agrisoli]|uniref:MFS transporter n=1 Tax=Fundidesulfovibrio agrisoli TaxID=2922717 RepID=UPI001FAC5E98|nr:MFS transporter [Fundidesulfovibrio agrisoli]
MSADSPDAPGQPAVNPARFKVLSTACLAHIVQDGLTDMLYVFFPVWQQLFALSFSEVGLLKTLFSGTLAALQIPAGALAARLGVRTTLAGGTVLTSLLLFCTSFAATPLALWALLILGGAGASAQHPVGASAIAQAYTGKASRNALSAYNFTGDLGKLLFPAVAALLIASWGWPAAMRGISGGAALLGAFMFLVMRGTGSGPDSSGAIQARQPAAADRARNGLGLPFWSMAVIGILDSATRMGFLTFLPFVLRDKGADMPTLGLALGLIFAGGAAGKLLCGMVASRVGILRSVIITEAATALMIYLETASPLWLALGVCPLLGVVLNGTSSILYGSVPELVEQEARGRAFACFYTGTIGAGAVAPLIYGALSDMIGVELSVKLVAAMVMLAVPLTLPLRGKMRG